MREGATLTLVVIVLAGGRSSRAGGANKLLTRDRDGTCMIVRTVHTALCSTARHVVLVLGHEAAQVRAAVQAAEPAILPRLRLTETADHRLGLSASLHAGIRAAQGLRAAAALVCLGDMPLVRPATLDRLAAHAAMQPSATACVPTFEGVDGNPVLWPAAWFGGLLSVSGDRGGRDLLGQRSAMVSRLPVNDPGVLEDFDTPERLADYASLDSMRRAGLDAR